LAAQLNKAKIKQQIWSVVSGVVSVCGIVIIQTPN